MSKKTYTWLWSLEKSKEYNLIDGEKKLTRRKIFMYSKGNREVTYSYCRRWFHAWALAGNLRITVLGIERHRKNFKPRW